MHQESKRIVFEISRMGNRMRFCKTAGCVLATLAFCLPSALLADNSAVTEGALVNATAILLTQDDSATNSLNAIGGTRVRAIGGTRVRADDDSDTQAIGGTRVRAIGGTRVRAIGGTRVRAIGGTRVRAIGGTRVRAIGGTRVRAIGGTRVRADDGSDTQAIGGTRVRAIGGTRVRSIESSAIRELGGARTSEIENTLGSTSFDRLVSGPVENIDFEASSFDVLNQTIQLSTIPTGLQEGVLVTAISCNDSSVPAILINDTEQFVPGVSEVLIEGYVEATSPEVGTFTVNGITVDYNSLLAGAETAPDIESGDHVIVRGTAF
jgi:hypothetical protein